jgi:hypothetical protein
MKIETIGSGNMNWIDVMETVVREKEGKKQQQQSHGTAAALLAPSVR